MPSLFPTPDTLHNVFHPNKRSARQQFPASYSSKPLVTTQTPVEPRTSFYAWSTIDDVKDKANKLSTEAAAEFEKASAKAQAKAGHIELYSAKYYAACTFGGLLACVSIEKIPNTETPRTFSSHSPGPYTYRCDTS